MTPTDHASLPAALEKAALFDLWRLKATIERALEDPRRNEAVRAALRPGQATRYYHAAENREIPCRVVEVRRTRALVRHDHDGKLWNIPFYMFNLAGDIDAAARPHQQAGRESLGVGDAVGYRSRGNEEVYGFVVRLSRKTATVRLTTGSEWRVPYRLLFHVHDVREAQAQETLPHQTIAPLPGGEEPLPE